MLPARPLVPTLCALLAATTALGVLNGCAAGRAAAPARTAVAPAAVPSAVVLPLGGAVFAGWSGLTVTDGLATLALPGTAEFRVADGPKGWHRPADLALGNDGAYDLRRWHGLRFELELDREAAFTAELTIRIPPGQGRRDLLEATTARIQVQGKGWHTVTVPFSAFDFNRGHEQVLKFVKTIALTGSYADDGQGRVRLQDVRAVRGEVVALEADLRSAPVADGGSVCYPVDLANSTEAPQTVRLEIRRSGWEGMTASVSPEVLTIAPGGRARAVVTVQAPAGLPAGAREQQTLVVTPQDGSGRSETATFTTVRRVPSPFLLHTADGWAERRALTKRYDWAAKQQADLVAKATKWEVPTAFPGQRAPDGTRCVFRSTVDGEVATCVQAWLLTGDRAHAEKLALYLRRLSDPTTGYPPVRHAGSQGIPQEGGMFSSAAQAYDAIRDTGLLNPEEQRQVETTLRLYIDEILAVQGDGGISNWSVFNLGPAGQCALILHDLDRLDRLLNGPCGIIDQLRYGLMDDGWWYEVTLSYNLHVAETLTAFGLACEPFGIDFLHQRFPTALTKKVGLRPFEFEDFLGMACGKYGPLTRNTVTLKQMWDGITAYPNYRGVMFGMGDGHEEIVSGGPFEIAYRAFRDPAYAAIIRQGGKRSLIQGVPDLPADGPVRFRDSVRSDNAGLAVLRSQTKDRPDREQIQVAMKYGTHGSYHGHFDRISLLSLMRYGRSFYNPETSWYGYASYMYKWWVQPSPSHNLVVVDGKQQKPEESRSLLFHAGTMMQASAAETVAAWSYPPYFGGYDQLAKVTAGDLPFVTIPAEHPKPGDLTGWTEAVRQRRLTIVTDDYVVVADDLRGQRDHTYDNLLHLRGARVPTGDALKPVGHLAQFDADPLGSMQFITNVDRYAATAPFRIDSVLRVAEPKRNPDGTTKPESFSDEDKRNRETGGAKSLSEPGELYLDAHVLWPRNAELRLGDYPENWKVGKRLTWAVTGDGRPLAGGTFGAWILGHGAVDVDVRGLKTLVLSTAIAGRAKDVRNTLFWGGGSLITANGKTIPLTQVKTLTTNVIPVARTDADYEGGPLRIAGQPQAFATAAEPQDAAKPALITVDLTGLDAVRFTATVGGDWPVGDEEQLRRTVAVRATGSTARFLTLLEPHEGRRLVTAVTADGPDHLHVTLADGRDQDLTLSGLDTAAGNVHVTLRESKGGTVIRQEETTAP